MDNINLEIIKKGINGFKTIAKEQGLIKFNRMHLNWEHVYGEELPNEEKYKIGEEAITKVGYYTDSPKLLKFLIPSTISRESNNDCSIEMPPFLAPIVQLLIHKGYTVKNAFHFPYNIEKTIVIFNKETEEYSEVESGIKIDYKVFHPIAYIFRYKSAKTRKFQYNRGSIMIPDDKEFKQLSNNIEIELMQKVNWYNPLRSKTFMIRTKAELNENSVRENMENMIMYAVYYPAEKELLKDLFQMVCEIPEYDPNL